MSENPGPSNSKGCQSPVPVKLETASDDESSEEDIPPSKKIKLDFSDSGADLLNETNNDESDGDEVSCASK